MNQTAVGPQAEKLYKSRCACRAAPRVLSAGCNLVDYLCYNGAASHYHCYQDDSFILMWCFLPMLIVALVSTVTNPIICLGTYMRAKSHTRRSRSLTPVYLAHSESLLDVCWSAQWLVHGIEYALRLYSFYYSLFTERCWKMWVKDLNWSRLRNETCVCGNYCLFIVCMQMKILYESFPTHYPRRHDLIRR